MHMAAGASPAGFGCHGENPRRIMRCLYMPALRRTGTSAGPSCGPYLRTLSDVASARSLAVSQGSFLASAHRELSVALVQSQAYVYPSCALLLAKASGQAVLPGADTPYLD
jgi:hypothetical protein